MEKGRRVAVLDTQRLAVVFVIVSFSPMSTEEDWQTGWAGAESGGGLLGVGACGGGHGKP